MIGVYTNEPSIHLRDARTSEMHQGALLTVGSMALGSRMKERYSRFDDANRAFYATASG